MGESEANDEQAGTSTPIEPKAPASQPFEQLNSSPPSQGTPNARRSSIRPAPASFKPTLRDNAKLPPPMVIHSGDAEKDAPSWGDPELPSYPSQIKVEKPLGSEPFALAEDLHLETLPLDLPKAPGLPPEAPVLPPVVSSEPSVTPEDYAANRAAPREPLAPRKKWLSIAIALVILGLVVVVMAGRGRPSSLPVTPVAPSPNTAAPEVSVAVPAVVAPSPNTAAPEVSVAVAPSSAPESAKPTELPFVPVTVTLIPPDAKLVFRGVAVPGPPYVIDVPKGKKVSMEASRRSYVTRKVTLDSTKSEVTVGLVLDKKHR